MKRLILTIYKKWFDEIASGKKKEEYRQIKPYWDQRLKKPYDVVEFRNGYTEKVPIMIVEFKGYVIKSIDNPVTKQPTLVYAILLGRILEIKNYGKIQQGKSRKNLQPYKK